MYVFCCSTLPGLMKVSEVLWWLWNDPGLNFLLAPLPTLELPFLRGDFIYILDSASLKTDLVIL